MSKNKDHLKFKIKGKPIDEYIKCEEWIGTSNYNTKRNRKSSLQQYVKFLNKTPDEIITEAHDEMKDVGTHFLDYSHNKYIKHFFMHLHKKDLSPKTINTRIANIISFYAFHDIIVKKKNLYIDNAPKKKENEERLTEEDIKSVLNNYCDSIMMKAYILVALSTGLASDDITRLSIKDIQKDIDEDKVTTITLHRKKTNIEFITFLNPDATEAVCEFLKWRNTPISNNDKINKKRYWDNQNDQLFIKKNIPDEYLVDYDDKKRCTYPELIRKYFEKMAKSANLSEEGLNYNVFRTHNLRSYFMNILYDKGYGFQDTNFLAGKSLGESFESYVSGYTNEKHKSNREAIKDKFKDYMSYLIFSDNKYVEVMKDGVRKSEEEIKDLKQQFDKYKLESEIQHKIDIEQAKMELELKPFDKRIEDLNYQIKENKKKLSKLSDIKENKKKISNIKLFIKTLEEEKFKLEYERKETEDYYINRINDIKSEE